MLNFRFSDITFDLIDITGKYIRREKYVLPSTIGFEEKVGLKTVINNHLEIVNCKDFQPSVFFFHNGLV